jgi:hypothetical protein
MGPSTSVPGQRLLAAVVEGTGGPWFFKLTGPDATVQAARDPFLAMIKASRASPTRAPTPAQAPGEATAAGSGTSG